MDYISTVYSRFLLISLLILSTFVNISNGLLSLPHLSEAFYLLPASAKGESIHPMCGRNFGKDQHTVGLTRVVRVSSNLKIPVSPIHYFYDGDRCIEVKSKQKALSSFLLHESAPQHPNLPIKTNMPQLVKSIRSKLGERDMITVHGVLLSKDGNMQITRITCGIHRLSEVVFVRPSSNGEVTDDEGKRYELEKEYMYAFAKDENRVCFYKGHSRAPLHAIGFNHTPSGFFSSILQMERDRKLALAVSIIAILCLSAFLYGGTFILSREAKKKEDEKQDLV